MAYRTRTGRVADPTIVATFAGFAEARQAIEALQYRIDATHMTLIGPRAEAAETGARARVADHQLTDRVKWQLFRGGIVGAAIGAAIGAIVGIVVVAFTTAPGASVVVTTLVVALLASAFWPYGTVISALGNNDAWEETLAGVPDGPVRLGIRAGDRREREWVVTTLNAHHATNVEERS